MAVPALMTVVVIGTGNHYVLDIVGSALLLTVCVLATSLPLRWRTRLRRPPG